MAKTKTKGDAVTRRNALGVMAGAIVTVGCGGAASSSGATGAGGAASGGAAGGGGSPSGGAPSGGAGGSAGSASGGAAGSVNGGAAGSVNGGAAGSASSLACHATGPTPGCKITDDNILGPFYKAAAPFRDDITDGQTGTRLVVEGTVYGCDCVTPLAGALVDVWQANDAGQYDNVGFTLRGRMTTDADGRYELHTILPGWYLNGNTYRPRHVHYKVSHPDGTALTTQLYFEGDPYIPVDPFVKPGLVMPMAEEIASDGAKQYRVKFDVVLA